MFKPRAVIDLPCRRLPGGEGRRAITNALEETLQERHLGTESSEEVLGRMPIGTVLLREQSRHQADDGRVGPGRDRAHALEDDHLFVLITGGVK